jgi:hypothetical protein
MFRFLFGSKRPVSPARASFRPRLEILEGRTLPSGFVPVSQDLAPQVPVQIPAQGPIQIQPITIQSSQQFDQFYLEGATGPHLTIGVDNLKTTLPPSTDLHGSSSGTATDTRPYTPDRDVFAELTDSPLGVGRPE